MCKLCETKPVYEFTNKRKVCARCFVHYFQKKFLYTVRKFNLIDKNDIVVYENKKIFGTEVLKDLLLMFAEKSPVKVLSKKLNLKFDKLAVPSTIDSVAEEMIEKIIRKNPKSLETLFPKKGRIIKPLYLFLDEEIELYAKIRKIKLSVSKRKDSHFSPFLDKLEEKHPEVKRAVVNSFLELYN